MNIAAILEQQSGLCGERPAIIERGRTITFAELNQAAASVASELSAAGLAHGARALVFSPMSIRLYAVIIGMFRLRVTAVFVDPSAGRARLEHCIARVRPDAFVAIPRAHLLRLTSPAIRSIPLKLAMGGRVPGLPAIGRRVMHAAAPIEPCDADTAAIVTFTSGSTGEPKAVVRTHGFLLAQQRALVESLALASGEVDLTTLPMFVLANLASGATSVIPDADLRAPGAISPAKVLDQIHATQPARTVASPAFLERLVAYAGSRGEQLATFRHIFTGGAPVFPARLEAIAAVAPRASVVAVYGSTEAEPIAEIDWREIGQGDHVGMQQGAGLLSGKPVASIHIRILADRWGTPAGPWQLEDLERESLAAGLAGEIVVCGAHVLTGYLDGQGDQETKIRVDDRIWHRTGDAGYIDQAGRLWLLGRCSAKVSDGHGILYPFAVECAASYVAGVRRSAFVLHRGRRILVVEANGGAARLRDALMMRLAWARLADVLQVRRIPVDARHNAKVDYPALRRMLES
jgi:acyl-CoA synthetase (AMP-forming)/AMP-acid ligase II